MVAFPGWRPRRDRNHYGHNGPTSGTVDTDVIARERIERLRDLAREATVEGRDERARRYVRRARRIAERNRLSLPPAFTRFTCDRCDAYQRPGRNARVRLQDGHVVVTCDCGDQSRYPYED